MLADVRVHGPPISNVTLSSENHGSVPVALSQQAANAGTATVSNKKGQGEALPRRRDTLGVDRVPNRESSDWLSLSAVGSSPLRRHGFPY